MKKNTVKKSVIATVLATSLFTSTSVSFANNSLQDIVDQARKDMKEAAYAYVVPSQNGKLATSVDLYPAMNIAKANYQKARNAILKSDAKNKDTLLKDLDDLYNERITKGIIPYIDAYNYADKYLTPIMADIKKAETEKDWAKVETLYHKLSVQLKSRTAILYRFTGKDARDLLLKQYKDPANLKRDQLMVPVTVYMKVKESERLLADGRQAEAIKVLETIKPLLDKLPSTTNMPMIKELLEELEVVSKKAGVEIIKPTTPPSGGSNAGGGNNGGNPVPNFQLSLMHTNDTHANLDNAPRKMTAIKEVRAKKPNAVLVDAGDVFSGTLYFNTFKGKADLELMNLMDYDVMTFGNHEFDLGSSDEGHKALADFIKGAKFPFVSSNVDFSKDDKFKGLFSDIISSKPEEGKIYNGIIKEINGEKVGFFGLTTQDTKDISSPDKVEFEDYLVEAEKAVKAFEGMGVNKIVAVSHIGYDDNEAVDNDLTLATKVDGIDIIVGGHSHTKLDAPAVINKDENGKAKDSTVIVHADQYNSHLGTLDVEFDKNGKVVKHTGKLIPIKDQLEDAEAKAILDPYAEQIKTIKDTPTGATAAKLLDNPRTGGDNTKPSVRKNETELGNLITDGMLKKAKEYAPNAIMALQNGGGIRTSIDQGAITVGEVINVLPFGNTLATMEVTGAELKEAFETSVKTLPVENGGFLHVSGAKVEYDSTKLAGERIVSISYENADNSYTEIKPEEKYTIATNAFTAKGGDGYDVFKKAYEEGRVTDLGLSDWENLRDHVKGLGTVDPKIEGRIVDVAGSTSEPIVVAPGDFGGTADVPKVHEGSVKVDITNIATLGNAVIKGDLILTGTLDAGINISNIKVLGNLDLSGVNGDTSLLENITVNGDTIL